MSDTEAVLRGYLTAALWTGLCCESEQDDNPEPLDSWAGVSDIPAEIVSEYRDDVRAFLMIVESEGLDISALDAEQVGHDFLLTRNHHGAGFWDRGLGELGDKLTTWAQSFGSQDLTGHREQDGTVTIYSD